MKILYIVSNINTASRGNGGHYYSMLATAEALKDGNEVFILNIGTSESIALQKTKFKIINIVDSKLRTSRLLKNLNEFLQENPVDIIHSFDDLAFFYSRTISVWRKIPIVLTKCGGVNPRYYPFCRNLVTFSLENTIFFKKEKKFRKSTINLIPNRVKPFMTDSTRIQELKGKHDLFQYDIVFLRISRIGKQYEKSAKQLINCVAALNIKGFKTCILFIGTVVDNSVLEELKKFNLGVKTKFETDAYFTKNAKELLDVADVVLGTGRSFMEAALHDKIMLAPLQNEALPILVTEDNFEMLLAMNFSERGKVNDFQPQMQINFLQDLLVNKSEKKLYLSRMKTLYNGNFNIESKREYYQYLYNQLKYEFSPAPYDTVLNYLFLQRRFVLSKSKDK